AGRARQHSLKSQSDERLWLTRLLRQLAGQQPRRSQRQRAVRQRQRLLRDDALAAAVALVDAGRVEQQQKLHLLLRGGAEVQAPPRHALALAVVYVRPALRLVEPPRDGEQAVAHRLAFHAAGVHPPKIAVVRILRQQRCRRRRVHAIRGAGDDEPV